MNQNFAFHRLFQGGVAVTYEYDMDGIIKEPEVEQKESFLRRHWTRWQGVYFWMGYFVMVMGAVFGLAWMISR